jgi:hypothetical protein
MDLRKLKTLIDLVSESNVSELEITEAESRVRIVKSEGGSPIRCCPRASRSCYGCPLGGSSRCRCSRGSHSTCCC